MITICIPIYIVLATNKMTKTEFKTTLSRLCWGDPSWTLKWSVGWGIITCGWLVSSPKLWPLNVFKTCLTVVLWAVLCLKKPWKFAIYKIWKLLKEWCLLTVWMGFVDVPCLYSSDSTRFMVIRTVPSWLSAYEKSIWKELLQQPFYEALM